MTSDNENHSYCPLKENLPTEKKSGKWHIFVFILSLIFVAEVLVTAILAYSLLKEINEAEEAAKLGEYPLHCLRQLVDPGNQENVSLSLSSCNLWIEELNKSAQKQLVSDIRNALFLELAARNISFSKKPAIHMGVEGELRQFPNWEKTGWLEDGSGMAFLHWDNLNGPALWQGMMGYLSSGEIVITREGLYFVYSQVYFQLFPSDQDRHSQQFAQYVYKTSESHEKPILLSKSSETKCWTVGGDFQLFSSHQGALFELQKGDRLSVKVHNVQSVRLQEDSTFFGAFMVN